MSERRLERGDLEMRIGRENVRNGLLVCVCVCVWCVCVCVFLGYIRHHYECKFTEDIY